MVIDTLLATQIEGARIMGWRPKAAEKQLKNTDSDFGYHYRMVFDRRISEGNEVACEGDVMILIARRSDAGYPNISRDKTGL